MFGLDKDKCVKCGSCVRDCAFRALAAGEDGYPGFAHPERCMKCQHCLAVCPAAAVSFDGFKPEDSIPARGVPLPSLEEVENWMRVRRSVRRFAAGDVDRALLERILKVLGNAPTGCNARALSFTCFSGRRSMDAFRAAFIKTVEKFRNGTHMLPRWLAVPAIRLRKGGEDVFFRGASGMLIVSSDETAPGVTTPREDVTIACSQFEMLANAAGIATCWCGFLSNIQKEIPAILEEIAGIRRATPFAAMLFGLPAVRYARGVQRESYARIDFRD